MKYIRDILLWRPAGCIVWRMYQHVTDTFLFIVSLLIITFLSPGYWWGTGRLPEHDRHTQISSVVRQSVAGWQRRHYCSAVGHQQEGQPYLPCSHPPPPPPPPSPPDHWVWGVAGCEVSLLYHLLTPDTQTLGDTRGVSHQHLRCR